MLYRDEKYKQIVRKQLQVVWQTARASKERTCWLGGLATLAWIACVMHLPPLQQAKSVLPHMVMIGVAYGISKTVQDNAQKATQIQKRTVVLAKELRMAHNSDDLSKIHRELMQLEDQFIIKSYRQKG